jgi:hypothetical protein
MTATIATMMNPRTILPAAREGTFSKHSDPQLFPHCINVQNPDRGPPDISGGRGLMRDLLTRALNDRSVETEPQEVQKSNVFSGG